MHPTRKTSYAFCRTGQPFRAVCHWHTNDQSAWQRHVRVTIKFYLTITEIKRSVVKLVLTTDMQWRISPLFKEWERHRFSICFSKILSSTIFRHFAFNMRNWEDRHSESQFWYPLAQVFLFFLQNQGVCLGYKWTGLPGGDPCGACSAVHCFLRERCSLLNACHGQTVLSLRDVHTSINFSIARLEVLINGRNVLLHMSSWARWPERVIFGCLLIKNASCRRLRYFTHLRFISRHNYNIWI